MCLKVLSTGQFVGSSNSHRYHWILKILISTEQSEVWEKKYERLFYYFNFERNNYVLKSKSPFISLNKNIYFNKNEKERKWKILHTVLERRTLNRKLKVNLWWVGAREGKKRAFFVIFVLPEGLFLNICVISKCIVYWIHFQN